MVLSLAHIKEVDEAKGKYYFHLKDRERIPKTDNISAGEARENRADSNSIKTLVQYFGW